jgi:hypothetical protein
MHLWCKFFVSRPILDEPQVDAMQAVINELLPAWSTELRVAKYEDSREACAVGRYRRLYDGVRKVAPPKRGIGEAVFTGSYPGLSFYFLHCDTTLPPTINSLSIEVYELTTVEGRPLATWAREFCEALAANLPMRYGNAHLNEEYRAKNMVDDETGVYAIGADILDAIPGLYWLNFFGAPYVEMISRDRLLSAPAHETKAVHDGVLVTLDESPDVWDTPPYERRAQKVIEHLGQQYLFSRLDPERKTIAPDFYALRDRADKA